MELMKLSCPCHFGLESVLASEAKKLNFTNVRSDNGRVSFEGDFRDIARANLWLRTAERVQIVLGTFHAESFDDLFEGIKALPFETFIPKDGNFPVTGYSLNSKLASIPDCQSIIKKAVVERLNSVYNISWFEETGPKVRIQFGIMKDEVSVYLDTSGAGLHKRGYRRTSTEAPIKETLAAGIVNLARIYPDSNVFDPFCGSGTILIEAALAALSIPPGINRRFQFETWPVFRSALMKEERAKAVSLVKRDDDFHAYGSDIDPDALLLARQNAKKAGVSSKISLIQRSIKEFEMPTRRATIITNPPYGERLLDIQEAVKLYRTMGEVFEKRPGINYYIISSYDDFEIALGHPADKKRKLYNGSIRCDLYMYFRNHE